MKGLSALLLLAGPLVAAPIDFNRDIRPILSDTCFKCHGPGEAKGDLRLDDREDALDAGVLSPGDVARSEFVARIFTDDPEELMPPPKANKVLTAEQKELLKRWIAEGAEYDDHWAFIPATRDAEAKGIDHFIDKRLAEEGLQPAPEADRRTLIRRVTLDLTGLPPAPAEVQAFVDDQSPTAFEKVVDRLLASETYGERMALAWLDPARYGDSSVMHADGPRDMWPWRDWVIKAYNANMPFDQFTVEQLAGDLIPEATVDQKIASGFNRNHATSDEGGAFPEELRVEYVADRVQTTANVWMGLTMECAQCHDHKYDPVSQREYYQFFAYFNNTTDPGMQTRNGNQAPVVNVPNEERDGKLAALQKQIAEAQEKVDAHRAAVATSPGFTKWLATASAEARKKGSAPEPAGLAHWFPLDETKGREVTDKSTGTVLSLEKGKLESTDRNGTKALNLNGKTAFKADLDPALEFDKPFSFAAWLKPAGKASGAIFSKMDDKADYRGIDFWTQAGQVGTHIVNTWGSNALKVVSKKPLQPNKWQHVVLSYDGSGKASGVTILIDGKAAETVIEADTLSATIATKQPFRIGSRSTTAHWKGGVDDLRLYGRVLTAEEAAAIASNNPLQGILAKDEAKRDEKERQVLVTHYLDREDKEFRKLVDAHKKAVQEHSNLQKRPITSMVMQDNPPNKTRMTYVLDRGAYDSPKKDEVMKPGVPEMLPPMPEDAPANRLGLAEWLVRPDHPLTARVAVNRYWMMFFGEGLVRTPGDFGAQGMPPTHPELLDWLAVDFVESGWNVKRMLRQIVLSDAYRRSSRIAPVHQEKDDQNELLARAPRFRLQGEFIRDQALAVGGLLVHHVGGPSVKPYQPPNIWNEVSLNGGLRYGQDKGEKLYRRSMYTYWKRSAPMPNMMILDAPTREKCIIQRQRTNTPLQALVTLNDPQFVEAGRAFAQRLLQSDAPDDTARLHLAFELAIARPAEDREVSILLGLLEEKREKFKAAPEAAKQFLSVGESSRDESLDPAEHAAWMTVAQTILNMDEFLSRN